MTNKDFFPSLSKYFHLLVPDHFTWSSEKANNFLCQWIWFPRRYWYIWEYNLAGEEDNLKPQTTLNTLLLTKREKLNWVGEKHCWMINCQTLCSSEGCIPFTPAAFLWILEERSLKWNIYSQDLNAAFAPQGGLGLEKQGWEIHPAHLPTPDPSCCSPHLKAHQPNCCQYFYSSLSCGFTVEVTIPETSQQISIAVVKLGDVFSSM